MDSSKTGIVGDDAELAKVLESMNAQAQTQLNVNPAIADDSKPKPATATPSPEESKSATEPHIDNHANNPVAHHVVDPPKSDNDNVPSALPQPASVTTAPAPAAPAPTTPQSTASPSPAAAHTPTPAPAASPQPPVSGDSGLDNIKKVALEELRPLVDKLDLPADEKFDTLLLLIRSTDDKTLVPQAHEAAKSILDEAKRAQALLDIIKEIDYFAGQK